MKKNYVLLGLVSLLSLPLASQAANVSASIQTTANVEASCSINIDNVEFGDLSPDNLLNKGIGRSKNNSSNLFKALKQS